jgi:hypothetical protein
MLGMLDEAIADLRESTSVARFDLNLVAFTDPLTVAEPLLPSPTPMEAIEDVLTAARLVDSAAERTSLLGTALAGFDRDAAALPAEWVAKVRAETQASLEAEQRIDRTYQTLAQRIVALGDRRARMADVRGVQRLVDRVQRRDQELGGQRPEAVNALIMAVEAQLDAARRLRLARDHWMLRAPAFRKYNVAIAAPLNRFATLKPSLENIKALAGTSPPTLEVIERAIGQILKQAAAIAPPKEFAAAHALLMSAVQLAGSAAAIRREATLAGDIARAWDASSAAAGALMLGARARSDIQALLRPPRLP